MRCASPWLGSLLAAFVGSLLCSGANAATPPADADVAQVRSRTFDVEYRVNDDALPLASVQLWYTEDSGTTWHSFGHDPDAQSPFAFSAPQEGLFGFYMVAVNDAGESSGPPASDTEPHQWVFVDYTPPVVQLHPVRVGSATAPRTLHVKWTAIDAHLASRPIELSYRTLPDGPWQVISGALSNTGRYDWRLDDGAAGRIMLRIRVRDRGGNEVEAAAPAIDLDAAFEDLSNGKPAPTTQPTTRASAPTAEERERARKLCEQALSYLERGEHRLAISRLRDALSLDPEQPLALVDLGRALYADGDLEESIRAYELALAQAPTLGPANAGIARTYVTAKRYDDAAKHLRELIRLNENDVEAWLTLGDVDVWRGDELSARASYSNAATLDPEADDVIAKAKARLNNLDLAHRATAPPRTPQEEPGP